METVIVDSLFPAMDASSAVYPTVRVVGTTIYLSYYLPGCVDSAVVAFDNVTSWEYGYPNDEGLRDHPLWGHGLTPYNFHKPSVEPDEETPSRWIATFHDGTFQIVAGNARPCAEEQAGVSPWEALTALLGAGHDRILDRES